LGDHLIGDFTSTPPQPVYVVLQRPDAPESVQMRPMQPNGDHQVF
jgi:hypothetical protein